MEYLDITLHQGPFSEEIKVENKKMAYILIAIAAIGTAVFLYFKYKK